MVEKVDDIELEDNDVEKGEKVKLQNSNSDDDSSLPEKSEKNQNSCFSKLLTPFLFLKSFYLKRKRIFKYIFLGALLTGYIAYFIIALAYDSHAAKPLVILTLLVLFLVLYEVCIKKLILRAIQQLKGNADLKKETKQKFNRYLPYIGMLACVAFCIWLIVDMILRNPNHLISVLGFVIILVICAISSNNPSHINWRPVIWGIALQFILGLIVLRSSAGYSAIKFIGDQVATFMKYADSGSAF
uniref:Concentrative nucleoside transporter N-terminal domain-containing protein n=1 Tax=Ciona savignyi TaxID=51511 RepID=H2YPF0_CIOSA